jgi:hypothetical protein
MVNCPPINRTASRSWCSSAPWQTWYASAPTKCAWGCSLHEHRRAPFVNTCPMRQERTHAINSCWYSSDYRWHFPAAGQAGGSALPRNPDRRPEHRRGRGLHRTPGADCSAWWSRDLSNCSDVHSRPARSRLARPRLPRLPQCSNPNGSPEWAGRDPHRASLPLIQAALQDNHRHSTS